jgi:hypothetical protein
MGVRPQPSEGASPVAKLIGDKRQPVDTSDRRMHLGAVGDLTGQPVGRGPDPPCDHAPLQLTIFAPAACCASPTVAPTRPETATSLQWG